MNDLRLIIFGLGLVLIAAIYLWEIFKQRERQRRQTVRHKSGNAVANSLPPMSSRGDPEDMTRVISDLNDFLVRAKLHEDESVAEHLKIKAKQDNTSEALIFEAAERNVNEWHPAQDHDLFLETGENQEADRKQNVDGRDRTDADDVQVIKIFIKAPDGMVFKGDAVFRAAQETGMTYGDMEIFHHFGIAGCLSDQPLFSMADMFEPGSFPLDQLSHRLTRGLVMFFCLPPVVDGQIILELMLNTAEQIATYLGAEIHGPNQERLNDQQIIYLRELVDMQRQSGS